MSFIKSSDIQYQIELKDVKLQALLEITNAINSNLPIEQLLNLFSFILKEQLGFKKFILLHHQEEWNYLVKTGYKGKGKTATSFLEYDLDRFNSKQTNPDLCIDVKRAKKKKDFIQREIREMKNSVRNELDQQKFDCQDRRKLRIITAAFFLVRV